MFFIKWLPPSGESRKESDPFTALSEQPRSPALTAVPEPFSCMQAAPGLLIADFLSAKATVQLLLFPLLVWPSYAIGILAFSQIIPRDIVFTL